MYKPICTIPLNFYVWFYSQPFTLVNINLKQILGCTLQLMQSLSKYDVSKRCWRGAFLIPFSSLDFSRRAYSWLSKAIMLPPAYLPPHSPFPYKSFFHFYATFGLEGSLEPFSKSITFTDIFFTSFSLFCQQESSTLWRLEFTNTLFAIVKHTHCYKFMLEFTFRNLKP